MTITRVQDYGILPNNTALANDVGFAAMRDALLAVQATAPSTRFYIHFEPGRYQYTNNRWLMGLNEVEVTAWESEFQCQDASGGGESWALSLPTLFRDTVYETNAQVKFDTNKIKTALTGASELELVDPADAINYAAGVRILVYGFNQQEGGFPPNPRYYEIVTVTAVAGAVLSLASPLRHSYHDNWPEVPYYQDVAGEARIISLDRPGYNYPNHVAIRGATIVEGASPVSTKILLTARHVVFDGVKEFNCVPTENETCKIDNCLITEMEIDKIVGRCEIKDSLVLGRMGGATGCEDLQLLGSMFDTAQGSVLDFHGRRLLMDRCSFYSPPGHPYNWFGLSLDYPIDSVVIKDCLIDDRGNQADYFIAAPGQFAILVDAVGPFGEILVEKSDLQKRNNWTKLDYGMELIATAGQGGHRVAFTQSVNSGVIQELYDNGEHFVIKGTWPHYPVIGQIWTYSTLKRTVIDQGNVLKGKPSFKLSNDG